MSTILPPTDPRHWSQVNVYELANLADCAGPDTNTSAGAEFLRSIYAAAVNYRDGYADEDGDAASEIADGTVPTYTGEVWETFTDLAAWQEDPTELGFDGGDMEQGAKLCLYLIGQRLAYVLMEQASETDEDEDEDETDEADA
jgi:hypothetical protein